MNCIQNVYSIYILYIVYFLGSRLTLTCKIYSGGNLHILIKLLRIRFHKEYWEVTFTCEISLEDNLYM